jgi:precorrin-6B methylase 1
MTTFETLSHVIDRIIHDADRELALAITSGAGTPEARAHTLTADGLQRAVRIVKAEREKYRGERIGQHKLRRFELDEVYHP